MQFSIRDYFTFASTFENGNVQLWDIRRPDRCERMFTAHNGPVFCCDWHPEDRCGVGVRGALRLEVQDTVGCGRVSFPPGEVTEGSSGTFSTGAGWPRVDETRW